MISAGIEKNDFDRKERDSGKNSIIYDVILEDGGSACMDEDQLEKYLERVEKNDPDCQPHDSPLLQSEYNH